MNENGIFKKKIGFTQAGNTLTRDKGLSLRAKGLYLLIMSYITFENISLTKSFIFSRCTEREKAFESIWNELKAAGYLKVYLQPSSKGWQVEYELLDEPKEGAHTFYLNASGKISCTNADRQKSRALKENLPLPEKGSNADGSNADGNNAKGCYAESSNNIKPLCNTNDKTINYNSFIQEQEGMKDDKLIQLVKVELQKCDGIPYEYCRDIHKMTLAIHYLTDWDIYSINGYDDSFQQKTFNLAVESLIEMVCEKEIKIYNKRSVTYANVIDKINQCIKGEACKNIRNVIEQAVEDYIKASSKEEIKYPRKYIKSCILENFDTYELKFYSLFNRTYYDQNYSDTTKKVELI